MTPRRSARQDAGDQAGSTASPPSSAVYRVAAIQMAPVLFRKEENVATLLRLTEEAAANGARLIVLPEMATTAYCWADREEIASAVEPIPGPTTARFGELAARHGCFIVIGLPEVAPATGVYYNSAALIGPAGVVGVYRKTHAYISEPKWAKDGDLGLPVFVTPLGRLAITICRDAEFPETTRVPALHGADVNCFPTNWISAQVPSPIWMARAFESGVYFVAANRYGRERGVQFFGGSCVIEPDGAVQSSLGSGTGILYGEVEVARARDKRLAPGRAEDKLADRRPDAYGNLTLNAYLWNAEEFHGLYGLRPLPEGRRSQVGVVQFAPQADDVRRNVKRIATLAAECAGTDLLVFPELATTGPIRDAASAERLAEPVPGPTTDLLRVIAAEGGASIVAGLVERDGPQLFNCAVLVRPEGVIGRYRKLHLTADDRSWGAPGDRGLPTFDVPVGRIGLLIGYDALFPEAVRALAIAGADLIASPSLVERPPVRGLGTTDDHFHLWRERARENSSCVAFANGAVPWAGRSGIFGPGLDDRPCVRDTGDGSAVATIATSPLEGGTRPNPIRSKELLRMRVPLWYDALQDLPVRRSHPG